MNGHTELSERRKLDSKKDRQEAGYNGLVLGKIFLFESMSSNVVFRTH